MKETQIGVLVGSLRKKSYTQSIANAAVAAAPAGMRPRGIEIGTLPIFNQDFDDEGNVPSQWSVFREAVKNCDGFLFVTPEYNRSVPPVLKNALDIGSRPAGNNLWGGKPGAVISVSPGRIGGFGASQHLRQALACLNVPTLQQPELYIGGVDALINEEGVVRDERTIQSLARFMAAFADWIKIFS